MLKMTRWLIWLVLSLAVLIGLDQLLVRVPLPLPGMAQVQEFYVDFRGRLLGLTGLRGEQSSIEGMIETASRPQPEPASPAPAQRYLYVDGSGALQFADSLQEVPQAYRQDAQPLAE